MTVTYNHLDQAVGYPMPEWHGVQHPAALTIDGQYCRLEPLSCHQHGNDLFEAFQLDTDNRTWTYLFMGPFDNQADFNLWLESIENKHDPVFFAIIDPASNKAIGVVSYMRIDPKNGVIEVGNLIFSPLLKQTPIATETMHLLIKHAFENLGYRRCEWKCDSLNAPSRRAAERLGFSFEGLFRQAIVYNGRNRDTSWYAIIDKDWPFISQAHQRWLSDDNFDQDGKQKLRLSDLTAQVITDAMT